ncbi:MAG: glycosyl transferase [Deltaproteobacteria bacterium]|nr:glycosyl transferase [Deltaproteobacteria bacterium]
MSDFFQGGAITTFHDFGQPDYDRLEAELAAFAILRPLALVLPSLHSELRGPALPGILDELSQVRYVSRVVVSLGSADAAQFREAVRFFSRLPQPVRIVWNDGPRMQHLKTLMRDHNLFLGEPGKGLAAWMACGYVLSDPSLRAVALHDCDIVTYDRILLHRLVYPILNPLLDYEFCKGFYARVSGRLYGRATRIFVTPLVRALQKILGHTPYLTYVDSFRYPLSGEFCMNADVARINRIPSDWGLEVGTLSEVFRNYSTRRICQVDLGINYEHKHQEAGIDDPGKGLMRMAREIALAVFHAVAAEGTELSTSFFRTLRAAYLRCAQDAIRQFADLSALNGLAYDRHAEDVLAEQFVRMLESAGEDFLRNPFGSPQIPNWNRVRSAIPDIFDRIRSEVDADNDA